MPLTFTVALFYIWFNVLEDNISYLIYSSSHTHTYTYRLCNLLLGSVSRASPRSRYRVLDAVRLIFCGSISSDPSSICSPVRKRVSDVKSKAGLLNTHAHLNASNDALRARAREGGVCCWL